MRNKNLFEESGSFHVDTHSSKHNSEVVLVVNHDALSCAAHKTCLTTNLGSNFVVGQTSSREDGDLLTTKI